MKNPWMIEFHVIIYTYTGWPIDFNRWDARKFMKIHRNQTKHMEINGSPLDLTEILGFMSHPWKIDGNTCPETEIIGPNGGPRKIH